jgi:hypothetical protein
MRAPLGKSARRALVLALLTLGSCWSILIAAGCARTPERREPMATPAGWHQLMIGEIATVAVPPDAVNQNVTAIDSILTVLHGEGYELIIDYGQYGPQVRERPDDITRNRDVDGRRAREHIRTGREPGQPWSTVRTLQVEDGSNQLTIRMSCAEEGTCALADHVFNSVRFAAR